MLVVALLNMVTSLLILILERTNMIGILKALGASNWSIRKIFLMNAAYIIGWGLFWGNLFGLGLGWVQNTFEFITLPEESYYVTVAPIKFSMSWILSLNVGTILICLIFLLLPSYLVSRIKPVRSIRFR
jgi:lipoprotein-releasing system permease protein